MGLAIGIYSRRNYTPIVRPEWNGMLNTVGSADGFMMRGARITLEKTREALSKA